MSGMMISVPASTANIGPGFDSIGMALSRYLTLHVTEHDGEWMFEHRSPHLPIAPDAKDHFIYKVAERMAAQYEAILPVCKVIVESEIPLARGMGSSASAVIAGIELANQLCSLQLTPKEKLNWASHFEGHPDNVGAALFGGLVITAVTKDNKIEFIQNSELNLDLVLFIPDFELKTDASRKVLPNEYTREVAATANGISNVMIAGFLSGNYQLAGQMMEEDLFHEPYRAPLIPNYKDIRRQAKELGAWGTVISGAGPTMISFAPKGTGASIAKQLQTQYADYTVEHMEIDRKGLYVEHNHSLNNHVQGF